MHPIQSQHVATWIVLRILVRSDSFPTSLQQHTMTLLTLQTGANARVSAGDQRSCDRYLLALSTEGESRLNLSYGIEAQCTTEQAYTKPAVGSTLIVEGRFGEELRKERPVGWV